MEIHTEYRNLHALYPKIVVGIGNFDGVHLGHRELIGRLVTYADRIGGTPTVLTFDPHPLTVLKPDTPLPLLLPPNAKQEFLARLGIRVMVQVCFDSAFARLTPEQFIEGVLHKELRAVGVFVGYNYTFGHMARGTPATLAQYAAVYNYHLEVIPAVEVNGVVVSSTHIRHLLLEGRVEEAASLLGYFPFTEGTVMPGDRRGSDLGFPTANLRCPDGVILPANGVYAVRVWLRRESFLGVANIGIRPTFTGNGKRLLEVHILNFTGDLYGERLRVVFLKRIRSERTFAGPSELIAQIRRDIEQARASARTLPRENLDPG